MVDKQFKMDLAKVLIATAWADGQLQNEEINSLKDLIFSMEEMVAEDWAALEIYMDSPIDEAERAQLTARLTGRIENPDERSFVIDTLERLIQADGVITEDEEAAFEEFKHATQQADTTLLSKLGGILKGAMGRRSQSLPPAARDVDVKDYIENTIYYQLKKEALEKGFEMDLPQEKIRQLCLAAGLLAMVANVDGVISDAEKDAIRQILTAAWQLSNDEAAVVAEICFYRTIKGMDYFRLTRGFFECTNIDNRRSFLACLFKVANASEKTSHDEIEQIRRISRSLKLDHKDFIAAKLTISDEDLGLT